MIKIHNGTPDLGASSLCTTCRHATITTGKRYDDHLVSCSAHEKLIRFHVSQCSDHDDKRVPSKWDMEQIAWVVSTDKRTKTIGFLSPAERKKQGIYDIDDIPILTK